MTANEAYTQYLVLINRNATNNKTNVDKPRFVLGFNNIQNKYLEYSLDKRNEDSIRNVQKVLVKDTLLSQTESKERDSKFALPGNYFDFANIVAKVKTDCCPEDFIKLDEIKSEDAEEKWSDTNNTPSYEWRESVYFFSNNTVVLLKKDFEYTKVLLTYYRYPVQIDLAGYIKPDGTASSNIDPEFDDKVVNTILLAMSKEFAAINSDAGKYQLDKDRLFTI